MRHARLFKQDDDFWIEDMGSQNRTWLNGSKMRPQQRQRVTPGDEVVVGQKRWQQLLGGFPRVPCYVPHHRQAVSVLF